MTEEAARELKQLREDVIKIRDRALYPGTFDAEVAVTLSHAVRALSFMQEGKPYEVMR